jgi:SAM-dependent methyltransferase
MTYDAKKQREAWAAPPIGGRSISSAEIVGMSIEAIGSWVDEIWDAQYGQPSNFDGGYRRHLGLDSTTEKVVMDFGCGFGFDALSYARTGNEVILADIREDNLAAASMVLRSKGFELVSRFLFSLEPPFEPDGPRFDVFHASGVLHHTPYAPEIMTWAARCLNPVGEMRLMLYTDHMFRIATGEDPGDVASDVAEHPAFRRFVRFCDAVGDYADWYSFERLKSRLPTGWYIASWDYLRPDRGNAIAIVKRASGCPG